MNKMFDKSKILPYSFAGMGILFLIIGIAFFVVSKKNLDRYREMGVKTEGVISSIHTTRSLSNRRGYRTTVLVTFTTNDGIEITKGINYYSSNMYTGMPIELYYDPDNPQNFVLESGILEILFPLIFSGLGSIFLIIGIVLIKKNNDLMKRKNKLISDGYSVMAEIFEVYNNMAIKINGRSPFVINAKYSENGKNYIFKSQNIWFDPSPFLNTNIRVYLDKHDYSIYYFDAESLASN